MSRLYNTYLKFKQDNPQDYLLFKSGVFYIFIDEDAKTLAEFLDLKLVQLNDKIVKCGFPSSALSKYITKLEDLDICFKIVDSNSLSTESINDYVDKNTAMQLIKIIKNLDLNNISPIEALHILSDLKEKIIIKGDF